MLNYILFDLDGTLTNPKEGITKAVQYTLKHMGIDVEDLNSLCKHIGPPPRVSFKEFWGLNDKEVEQALIYYRDYSSKIGIFQNEVYLGIDEMLASLVKNGKQLIIATSKLEVFAKQILEYFNLSNYFMDICGSTMDTSREKKGDIIRYALEKNNIVDLNQVIMVGDRSHDIIGSKENEIASVGVLYGFGSREELMGEAADYIVETVEQLYELLMTIK
jgi:phosphoglycolate phosphatase